jgi:hypothetical protein
MILDLIPRPYRLLAVGIAAAALAAGSAAAAWSVRGAYAEKDLLLAKADYDEKVRESLKAERKNLEGVIIVERAIREDVEGTANAERNRAAAAEAALARLDAGRDGLLNDLRRYSAARACPAGPAASAAGGTAAETTAGLVSGDVRDELLAEGRDAVRQLAPALDAAKADHADIVALWNKARERLKRFGEAGRTLNQ